MTVVVFMVLRPVYATGWLPKVAKPLHGDIPQPNFEMGLAMGEVISWMKAALQKIHDDNMDNDTIRETMDECLQILSEPSMENIDRAGDKACELLNIKS